MINSIRNYDIAGRYGEEEFLIVLPDTDFENALMMAERMRRNIKTQSVEKSDMAPAIAVTISLGIASMLDTDISIDNMIKRADDGLYAAKKSGRDKVSWV